MATDEEVLQSERTELGLLKKIAGEGGEITDEEVLQSERTEIDLLKKIAGEG